MNRFDAIVVGGGHAGIEATFALANNNFKVALVTLDRRRIAQMPCNPAIGGPAKGILTREIDALGGVQGLFSDQAMIQIKMLNYSKGPAVKALRAQIDKDKYSKIAETALEKNEMVTIIEGQVDEILTKKKTVTGVALASGITLQSEKVVITTGTYMNSYVLQGHNRTSSGPDNQSTSTNISQSLKKLGIRLQRLKTGTSPRVLTSSIDFSQVEKEILTLDKFSFSSRSKRMLSEQASCYITYTNEQTHQVINDNITKSSMYSGQINGVAPRYCPSIEDKVSRFSDKDRHQIFYEPETAKGDVIYINGFSTSMPINVQKQMLKTLPGMKNAQVSKWAYAIEYDAIDPLQIKSSLESKIITGLFFAGQVNGTSGYEEAAAQGLMAGINVSQLLKNKDVIVLGRDQSYIAVLIDDLVTKGTKEPYRMLTSRAEYRLLLRNDNADERLSEVGFNVGLVSFELYKSVKQKYEAIREELKYLAKTFVKQSSLIGQKYNVKTGTTFLQLLARPEVDWKQLIDFEYGYELMVNARLAGYIAKQEKAAKKLKKLEHFKIAKEFDYSLVNNLASEAVEKLKKVMPETLGQAARIPGINPSDIQMLLFHIEVQRRKSAQN